MANQPAPWMREAAEEWCEEEDTDATRLLAETIARHAPSEEQVRELVEAAREEVKCPFGHRVGRLRRALEPFKEIQ